MPTTGSQLVDLIVGLCLLCVAGLALLAERAIAGNEKCKRDAYRRGDGD